MALRHKSRRKPLFSLDALTDEPEGRLLAEEVIQTEERNRVLHFCMGEMNPDYREVLYLTYFEEYELRAGGGSHGKNGEADHQHGVSRKGKPAKAAGTGGDHKCGVMRNGSRRPSGASLKLNRRNGCGTIWSPWLPLWLRALCCSLGASFAMPGIAASIQAGNYAGFETAASMYGGGAALGYIVIGLLAFLLGVCVTVLCFRLRQMSREDGQDKESEDAHGAD